MPPAISTRPSDRRAAATLYRPVPRAGSPAELKMEACGLNASVARTSVPFVPATTKTRPSGRGAAPAPARRVSSEPVGEKEPDPLAVAS